MDEKFWLRRWEQNEIGFHKSEPHHFLLRFFDRLLVAAGDAFFVPLCGKSPDLAWLRAKGLEVIGIELSRTALEAFVSENGLCGSWSTWEGIPGFHARGYRLLCGDYFNLTPAALGGARGAYDRGALVALPAAMRRRYAEQLALLLPAGGRALAVSYAYDQAESSGPPFSVPLEEITQLFGADFEIELLVEEDTLWSHQGLAARGVTQLSEFAVLLTRK